jgi:uncharacterized membrane protein YoaK (UPF0700 family)
MTSEGVKVIMRLHAKSSIRTFLLVSFTVGYCDAITFFTSGVFSGYVLGNIIFSAYQLLHDNIAQGLILLLSIPVCFIGLFIAKQLLKFTSITTNLLKTASIVIMVTGLLSAITIIANVLNSQFVCILIAFLIIVAMGIIGAAKYGSTKAFSTINSLVPGLWSQGRSFSNRDSMLVLLCFVAGCASGAVAGNFVGLSGVILPGVLLFLFTMND